MLRPLDPKRLNALALEDGVDDGLEFCLHHRFENIRRFTKEGEKWAWGVQGILHEGGDFVAFVRRTRWWESYEKEPGPNEWIIDFCVRAPDRDHGTAITNSPSSFFLSKT